MGLVFRRRNSARARVGSQFEFPHWVDDGPAKASAAFRKWLDDQAPKVLPESYTGKAIAYG